MKQDIKNILITGASSGIGEALALYYAQRKNVTLFLCGRNKERLELVKEQCEKSGSEVYTEILDVTDRKKTAAWIKKCDKIAPLNLVFDPRVNPDDKEKWDACGKIIKSWETYQSVASNKLYNAMGIFTYLNFPLAL